ncbi:uncharacterized protein LAESUDRAFT_764941 [Laetiporus sulphureus 93-53]|uniref:Uncharacterized protein n=1 Tax=Laetiporus sulphureus 93-53 TaxID=1314785 RepID=A0A165B1U5_9APHY|nr:uncharacterized protein LAESUDRAFT_764941 [Laetiporus sulphureus 93-53]KZT00073.1 hypothetical protein LAESUDRAFT_764941 [Laetiporus sulphureus 93-53]
MTSLHMRRAATIAFATALWTGSAGAASVRHCFGREATSFDGQYIDVNVSNVAVEWWYAQAVAVPVGDNPAANVEVLFYQGYPILEGSRDPSDPEYYVTINGIFANGTAFNFNLPASTGAVTSCDDAVHGSWGEVGSFHVDEDLSSFTATISAPAFGVSGTIQLQSNAVHHFACNSTVDAYFDSAMSSDLQLNTAEEILFEQLGWATTIPGGTAHVNLSIDGTAFDIIGNGYHDANWSPVPLNEVVSSWYFLQAQVGPFDMSGILAVPLNSTRNLSTGYLSESGVILQNQCSLAGSRTTDFSNITTYGSYHDSTSNVTLPTGFILSYITANGDEYAFNLTSLGQNPDETIYHRWIGTASGGEVGGAQYTGTTVFEWLNPGLNIYDA